VCVRTRARARVCMCMCMFICTCVCERGRDKAILSTKAMFDACIVTHCPHLLKIKSTRPNHELQINDSSNDSLEMKPQRWSHKEERWAINSRLDQLDLMALCGSLWWLFVALCDGSLWLKGHQVKTWSTQDLRWSPLIRPRCPAHQSHHTSTTKSQETMRTWATASQTLSF